MGHNLFARAGAMATDHLLGPAYQTIKDVNARMNEIVLLADNMAVVEMAANNVRQNILVLTKEITEIDFITYVDLPVEISQNDLFDYKIVLVDQNGVIYNYQSDYFLSLVQNDTIEVSIKATAPAELVGGTVKATIFYHNKALEE